MDLDRPSDLDDRLVEKALRCRTLSREPAQLDQNADMTAELFDVGRCRRRG